MLPPSKKRNLTASDDTNPATTADGDGADQTLNNDESNNKSSSEMDQKQRLVWQDRESLERFRIDHLIQLKQDRKRNEEKKKQIELLEKFDEQEEITSSSSARKLFREIETSQQKENIIKLNVRGKLFVTTLQTLTRRESMIKLMLESQIGRDEDENGCITIDRDPDYFPIILEHLRTGSTTHIGIWEEVTERSIELLNNLLEESDYFATDKLTAKVKELITKYSKELQENGRRANRLTPPKHENPIDAEPTSSIDVTVDDDAWYAKFAMLTLEEKTKVEKYVAEQTKEVKEEAESLANKEKSLPSTRDITIDVRGVKFTISTSKLIQHVDSLFYEFAKKAIHKRGEFEIFLDRDPIIFAVIYEYLINGTVQNIPNEIEKKKQVFKEAKFFKLKGLLEFFDICRYPIEDIGERNLKIKHEEDFLRNLFAVDRSNAILNDPYIHLINLFGEDGHSKKSSSLETQNPPEKVKLLFDFEDPMEVSSLCQNSKLIVPCSPMLISSRDQFLKQFTIFTGGIFKGMDWSNVFVAGGSVLACALQVPTLSEQTENTYNANLELYNRHKMTEKYWENDDASSSEDDISTVNTSEANSDNEYFTDEDNFYSSPHITMPYPSATEKIETTKDQFFKNYYDGHPWKKSDIDLFLFGISEAEAEKKIEYLYNTFKKNLTESKESTEESDEHSNILILRTQHAITFRFNDLKSVQIILRIYKSPAEILCGFDIPCCCIGFDGTQVFCIPRAKEAIKMRCNIVDPDRQSTTYETRLVKYALRGFRIGICGYDPKKIVNPVLQHETHYHKLDIKQFTGLARILMILNSFKKNEKKRVFLDIGGNHSLNDTEKELIKPSSKHDYAQITLSINYQSASSDYNRLNDRVDFITKNLGKKPFFEYALNDIEKILRPIEMKSDLSPVLEFIQIEPTRQYVGCFSPIDKNFLEDAYTFVRNERKCKYKYVISSGPRQYRRRRGTVYSYNTTLDSKTCATLESIRRKCKKTGKTQEVIIEDIKITFSKRDGPYGGEQINVERIGNPDEKIDIYRYKDDKYKYFTRKSRVLEDQNDQIMDEYETQPIKINDPWYHLRFKNIASEEKDNSRMQQDSDESPSSSDDE